MEEKYEWRKNEKEIYGVTETPQIVDIPSQKFICIDNIGNPNSKEFAEDIEALYGIAYTIKMKFKDIENYFEYTVYPLEGFWSLTDKGIKLQQETGKLDKNEFKYTLMIKQPSFVDNDIFNKAIELAIKNKKGSNVNNIYFKEIIEGLSLQILHNGSYDNEPKTFDIMKQYIKEHGYKRMSFNHKEIYLSDARKVIPEKLKTILRVSITK